MNTLEDALAKIAQGWNLSQDIAERAVLARSHAQKGHAARAEEVAAEIDALQRATFLHENATGTWDGDRVDGIVWRLSTAAWADMTVQATRASRYITTPFGTSLNDAEAHARNIRRPRLPLTLERVDQFQRAAA